MNRQSLQRYEETTMESISTLNLALRLEHSKSSGTMIPAPSNSHEFHSKNPTLKRNRCDVNPEEVASKRIKKLERATTGKARASSYHNDTTNRVKPTSDAKTSVPVRSTKVSAPYFSYKDYSAAVDPNPSTPITKPGHVPNFPAKIYEILNNRPDLADIVSWLPHGRSWKVHKPKEFEAKVIPLYFEHKKYTSFVRQVNGWGFRRIISPTAKDRNSYYHELFLRGKPFLLKQMERPAAGMKPQVDESTEPDLYRISQEHPLPGNRKQGSERRQTTACWGTLGRPSVVQRPRNSSAFMMTLARSIGFLGPNTPTHNLTARHSDFSSNPMNLRPATLDALATVEALFANDDDAGHCDNVLSSPVHFRPAAVGSLSATKSLQDCEDEGDDDVSIGELDLDDYSIGELVDHDDDWSIGELDFSDGSFRF